MRSQSINALIAILLAILMLPTLMLLDYLNRGCGDGLCGTFSGLLVISVMVIATLVFIRRSARRNESPAFLRLIPFVVWLMLLFQLAL